MADQEFTYMVRIDAEDEGVADAIMARHLGAMDWDSVKPETELIAEARRTLAQYDRVWANTSNNPLPTRGVSAVLRRMIATFGRPEPEPFISRKPTRPGTVSP